MKNKKTLLLAVFGLILAAVVVLRLSLPQETAPAEQQNNSTTVYTVTENARKESEPVSLQPQNEPAENAMPGSAQGSYTEKAPSSTPTPTPTIPVITVSPEIATPTEADPTPSTAPSPNPTPSPASGEDIIASVVL